MSELNNEPIDKIQNALTIIQDMVKDIKRKNCYYDISSFRPNVKGIYIITSQDDDLKLLTDEEMLVLIDSLKILYPSPMEVYYSNIDECMECHEIEGYKPFDICPESEKYLTIKF